MIYSPLNESNEIWLLYLQPHVDDGLIKCTIEHTKLSEKPRYEALSYMWGPSDMKTIEIDTKIFKICENLWAALCHLVPTKESRVLWIDAICVNQDNDKKRGHQVEQMGEIYGQATKVVVWLGVGSTESKLAFEVLACMRLWMNPILAPVVSIKKEVVRKLNAVKSICVCDYWTRLWIMQKVLIAQDIVVRCGQ